MSFQLMSGVIKMSGLKATDKFVLLMIANYADEEGKCWPSVSRLSKDTGLSRRAVQYALRDLEAFGYMDAEKRIQDDGQSSNMYYLRGVQELHGGVHVLHGGGAPVAPKPINEPINIKTKAKKVTSKTRMPRDWKPSLETVGILKDLGYTEQQINQEAYSCREYFSPLAKKRAGWERTFINWMERSNHQPREKYTPPKKHLPGQYVRGYAQLLRDGKDTPESLEYLIKHSV